MNSSDSTFDCVDLLYYKCHKINPSCGGSYVYSLTWIRNKKVIINPTNKEDNRCFQYAATVALNYEKTG